MDEQESVAHDVPEPESVPENLYPGPPFATPPPPSRGEALESAKQRVADHLTESGAAPWIEPALQAIDRVGVVNVDAIRDRLIESELPNPTINRIIAVLQD